MSASEPGVKPVRYIFILQCDRILQSDWSEQVVFFTINFTVEQIKCC